jgi:hypothetical protein
MYYRGVGMDRKVCGGQPGGGGGLFLNCQAKIFYLASNYLFLLFYFGSHIMNLDFSLTKIPQKF